MTKRLSPSPDHPRPLNQVVHECWRRLRDSSVALAEFNRALREGELVAPLYQGGKGLRNVGRSYWRRSRLEFDREEPLVVVVVVIGDASRQRRFYISPASRPGSMPPGYPVLLTRIARIYAKRGAVSTLALEGDYVERDFRLVGEEPQVLALANEFGRDAVLAALMSSGSGSRRAKRSLACVT